MRDCWQLTDSGSKLYDINISGLDGRFSLTDCFCSSYCIFHFGRLLLNKWTNEINERWRTACSLWSTGNDKAQKPYVTDYCRQQAWKTVRNAYRMCVRRFINAALRARQNAAYQPSVSHRWYAGDFQRVSRFYCSGAHLWRHIRCTSNSNSGSSSNRTSGRISYSPRMNTSQLMARCRPIAVAVSTDAPSIIPTYIIRFKNIVNFAPINSRRRRAVAVTRRAAAQMRYVDRVAYLDSLWTFSCSHWNTEWPSYLHHSCIVIISVPVIPISDFFLDLPLLFFLLLLYKAPIV